MKYYNGKRILICSDTHGRTLNLEKILGNMKFDAMIFLGDGEGLEDRLSNLPGCPAELYMIKGNNDHSPSLPESAVIELGSHRIYLTHGHRYHLYFGYTLLISAVKEKGCDYCFFGHLHKPILKNREGVQFLNPGSLSEPRQDPHIPTCAIMVCDGDGDFTLSFLDAEHLTGYVPQDNDSNN